MPATWVFTVDYRNVQCKTDARNLLNAMAGVSATHENRGASTSLSRDVTVIVSGSADRRIPGKILNIFGTIRRKQSVFRLTFSDGRRPDEALRRQNEALRVVRALRGVERAEFERVEGSATELRLKVTVSADPQIVRNILETYGARILG